MSGVAVVRALLVASAPLTSVVSAARISAGVLPVGTAIPSIGVMEVSSSDRNKPKPGLTTHVRDRVQVTVMAANYVQQKQLIRLVRSACKNYIGDIAGVTEVTVHTDGRGPDFDDVDAGLYMQTQDFLVEFNETT